MANLNDVIDRLKAEGDLNRNSGTNSNKVIINEIDLTNVTLKRIADSMQSILSTMVENSMAASAVVEKSDDESDPNEVIQERSAKIDDERDENELIDVVSDIRNIMMNVDGPRKKDPEDPSSTKEPKTAKEVRKMSDMFKGFFKIAGLGLGANILFGSAAGPALLGLGVALGNPMLMAVGGMATLIDLFLQGNLLSDLQALADGDKTLGDIISEQFTGLIDRIAEQLNVLYEAIVPEETREKIEKFKNDLFESAFYFHKVILKVARFLGLIETPEDPEVLATRQALSEAAGREIDFTEYADERQRLTYAEAAAFLSPEELDRVYRYGGGSDAGPLYDPNFDMNTPMNHGAQIFAEDLIMGNEHRRQNLLQFSQGSFDDNGMPTMPDADYVYSFDPQVRPLPESMMSRDENGDPISVIADGSTNVRGGDTVINMSGENQFSSEDLITMYNRRMPWFITPF